MKATNPSQRIKRTSALLRRIGFQRRFLGGAGAEGGDRGAEAISNGMITPRYFLTMPITGVRLA